MDINWSDAEFRKACRARCKVYLTDDEFDQFMFEAQKRGLDPTLNQIWPNKRWDKNARKEIYVGAGTGIDGFRVIAQRTSQYAGQDDPVFEYDGADLKSVLVRIYRYNPDLKERVPYPGVAFWDEYVQTDRNGEPTRMWKKLGHGMLTKCAESLAFRRGFPELGGLYTKEEMSQADDDRAEASGTKPSQKPDDAGDKAVSVQDGKKKLEQLARDLAEEIGRAKTDVQMREAMSKNGVKQWDEIKTIEQAKEIYRYLFGVLKKVQKGEEVAA